MAHTNAQNNGKGGGKGKRKPAGGADKGKKPTAGGAKQAGPKKDKPTPQKKPAPKPAPKQTTLAKP